MIEIKDNLCDFCGGCVSVCPVDAIELKEAEIIINPITCTDCQLCIWVCPISVLSLKKSNEMKNENV